MNKFISLGIILALVFFTYAFTNPKVDFSKDEIGGIQFYRGGFEAAMKQAKIENKLIFIDVYASWCGPCKKLKANTFSNKDVGNFYNSNFINIAVNGEEGEGFELAKKYQVQAYPTLLFINYKGEVIKGVTGYHNSLDFVDLGKSVLK